MTKLDKPIRRDLSIRGKPYVVSLLTEGLKLSEKGTRVGQKLAWDDLVSGHATLAVALNASVALLNGCRPRMAGAEALGRPAATSVAKAKRAAPQGRRVRSAGRA